MEKVEYNGYEMSKNLKALIENSIEDNKISDAERKAIHHKAGQEGFSNDEIDILLDSLILRKKKQKKKGFIEYWTKKDEKGDSRLTLPMIVLFVLGIPLIIFINMFSSESDYEEKIDFINKAITGYNIEEARDLLGEFEALDISSKVDHDFTVTDLYIKAYNSEIDYYLKNAEYDFAITSISELYNICASRPFKNPKDDGSLKSLLEDKTLNLDKVMDLYYYPEVTKLISKLESDGQDSKLQSFVNSIPHAKTKEKILKSINKK